GHHRRLAGADPYQPDPAADRYPGAPGHRHPGHPDLHPDPYQPAQRAWQGRQQAAVPRCGEHVRDRHLRDEPAPARQHDPRLLRDQLAVLAWGDDPPETPRWPTASFLRHEALALVAGLEECSGDEAVAHAGLGEQVVRARWLRLQLAP